MPDLNFAVIIGPGVRFHRPGVFAELEAFAAARGFHCHIQEVADATEAREALAASSSGVLLDPGDLDVDDLKLDDVPAPVLLSGLDREPPWSTEAEGWAQPIYGRGAATYRWALRRLHNCAVSPPAVLRYGTHPDQVGDLWRPASVEGRLRVAVLLHGGFWQDQWQRDLMDDLSSDLVERGVAVWNLEYRRVGPGGGGVPATLEDAADGLAHVAELAETEPLDPEQVVIIGHSAGGQLALWLAAAGRLGYRRHDRSATVRGVVSLAGMPHLEESARRRQGDRAVIDFAGGMPEVVPESYRLASPIRHLPLQVPHATVQGLRDDPDLIDLNRLFVDEAAVAGDATDLCELDTADHFTLIDPSTTAWARVVDYVDSMYDAPQEPATVEEHHDGS